MAYLGPSAAATIIAGWTANSGSTGEQRPKSSCGRCQRVPPVGQPPWLICTGCSGIRYCSASCQYADWPVHRYVLSVLSASYVELRISYRLACLESTSTLTARTPTRVELSSYPQVYTKDSRFLLRHWIVTYAFTLNRAILCALLERGRLEDFPYTSHYLHLKLAFQPDCEGNASRAFTVESGAIYPWDAGKIHPELVQEFGNEQPSRSCLHTLRSAATPNYAGCLNILYDISTEISAKGVWESKPIYRIMPEFEATVRSVWGPRLGLWIDELRSVAAAGIVLNKKVKDASGRSDASWVPGKMVRREGKWEWVEMSREEIVQACIKAGIGNIPIHASNLRVMSNS